METAEVKKDIAEVDVSIPSSSKVFRIFLLVASAVLRGTHSERVFY